MRAPSILRLLFLLLSNLAIEVVEAATFSVPGFVQETLYQGNGMISMRFDFAGRLWVVEKQGRILIFTPDGPTSFGPPVVFADLVSQVNTLQERGMMGLALDPDFENNRYVYVLFSMNSDQRIVRLTSNPGFTGVVPGSELILLSGLANSIGIHKAGDIAFHPKDPNNLYVVLGDDGQRGLVGNLDFYHGKILKISASDGRGLPTNPYYNGDPESVRSRIWSTRYRNPFRFTFDPTAPVADVFYISENGDGTDRIARIEKGADGGWDNQFTSDSADAKRRILETSAPSKTGIAIFRSGPFSIGGAPTLYNARHDSQVRRWTLTGDAFDTLTPISVDGGGSFASNFGHNIASFTAGPDGALYYTSSDQGASTGTGYRLARIRFVGGTPPVAAFTSSPESGQTPLDVHFTDTSTASSSSLTAWHWDFGDGATSMEEDPAHAYAEPGVYAVTLTVTNAQGLEETTAKTITAFHDTTLSLTGIVYDSRGSSAFNLASATELRFYQSDGQSPLAVSGGTGAEGNRIAIAPGGEINVTFSAQITGDGIVVSAGESASDEMQPAFVGIPLSTTDLTQSASIQFYLSDTLIRGQVLDTKGRPAQVDIGVARDVPGDYYDFPSGRDFLPASGIPASGVNHRTGPDALGYYHVPIRSESGDAAFHLDTSADTLSSSHGRVRATVLVASGTSAVDDLTIGLYDGGTDEADLSAIGVTPNVDFALQIQPIFSASCAACHNEIATNSGGLDLQRGVAFEALVNQESTQARGVMLVQEGSALRSYLMEKVSAVKPQRGTSMRPGDPMPLAQQALIRDWINQLIPPDPNAPPAINSPLAVSGLVGNPFAYQITAANLPTSFAATDLPPGLSIELATGLIFGTPTVVGETEVTLSATNENGTDSETLILTIAAGPAPEIDRRLVASGPVGTAFSHAVSAANLPTQFTALGLPPGLSIDPASGLISGTPTHLGITYTTITATNANGTDAETLVVTIHAPFVTVSLNSAGVEASSTEGGNLATNGNDSNLTTRWAASDGSFPQWWRLDLGRPQLIGRIEVEWFGDSSRRYQYRLEVSDDDVNYTEVVDQRANTVTARTVDSFPATVARYVRITTTGSSAGWASFYEFSVFGTDVPPALPFDIWRIAAFGEQASDSNAQAEADFDDDRYPNLIEFVLGKDPTEPDSEPGYTLETTNNGRSVFSFTRPLSMAGVTIRLEASNTLAEGSWETLAQRVGDTAWTLALEVSVEDRENGAVAVTDHKSSADEPPQRFLRLTAEVEPPLAP